MNNYFGIGLDAKISLEFNNKREEHPEKCSRSAAEARFSWFLRLFQCDGQYIPLPSLQGIAVLNIPSYAGGTNFWGGTKEDDVSTFTVH
ncbi:hypothetical protein GOODEAATRI_011504 [Goodea atripinnis]|uniref:Diacylglycerol kinase accessory domain-containing protein n=1 Tax=Goodea atripinnis TaxID=208336 RepID=A0ABV0N9T1_9TELE